jgi:hypothetical protein
MPIVLLLFGTTWVAEAAVVRVAPSGNGTDGESWISAFVLVGEALANSASGDQIWVASGIYNESIKMKAGVSMFGGFDGMSEDQDVESRDWIVNRTVLDATGLQTVVVEGASHTVIDGFTITNGDNRTLGFSGGGIRVSSVTDMVIVNLTCPQ